MDLYTLTNIYICIYIYIYTIIYGDFLNWGAPQDHPFLSMRFSTRNHPWFFVAQESGFTHHLPGNHCGKFGKYMGNPPFVESKETFQWLTPIVVVDDPHS